MRKNTRLRLDQIKEFLLRKGLIVIKKKKITIGLLVTNR